MEKTIFDAVVEEKEFVQELAITPETIVVTQDAKISFKDFDLLKEQAASYVAQYKGLVLTTETMKDIKNVCADLNNKIKILEDARKKVKKQIELPYKNFENQVKEIVGVINDARDELDGQVKEEVTKQKEEKKKKILKVIEQKKLDLLEEYLGKEEIVVNIIKSFNIEFDTKWLNSSTSKKKIVEGISNQFSDLTTQVNSIIKDIGVMTLNLENGARIRGEWERNGYNLVDATEYVLHLIAREKEEQAKIQATMEKKNLVSNAPKVEIKEEPKQEVVQPQEVIEEEKEFKIEDLLVANFKATGTITQLRKLKQFALENNIRLESI